jgi:hypothetical protein
VVLEATKPHSTATRMTPSPQNRSKQNVTPQDDSDALWVDAIYSGAHCVEIWLCPLHRHTPVNAQDGSGGSSGALS